jgi:hypothetical protein
VAPRGRGPVQRLLANRHHRLPSHRKPGTTPACLLRVVATVEEKTVVTADPAAADRIMQASTLMLLRLWVPHRSLVCSAGLQPTVRATLI